ncbi:MAG: PDZ domain-containing protein [Gammaproteobacteria bacterium]|nr:PDZ domain-containing protein [Gammaproteobacteria bacterium]MDP7456112.1 PDZ domain-containing protein [Gammaproteobacteria bacterium]HJO12726.1 PDZ domain-containing protein [Gammaproteobacteria bacterium]
MNKLWLVFALLAPIYWQSAIGQAGEQPTVIDASELNYYLYQSFAAADTTERLRLNHIGMQTELLDGVYFVSSVLDGYPAHRAGIQRGDRLLTVNGISFHPVFSFNNTVAAPAGFRANPISYDLELSRGSDTQAVSVTPVFENLYDSYRTSSFTSIQEFTVGNKIIGYVHLWSLSRSSNDLIQYQAILNSLSHCDGIIVDIRDSFGFVAYEHFDALFPSRSSYFQQTVNGQVQGIGRSNSPRNYYGKPLAVLQNNNTQGGMELFSYQLSKLQRVITLGDTTAGLLGDYIPSEQEASTELIYLPAVDTLIDGVQFEDEGRTPQEAVDYPITRPSIGDPQYDAALAALVGIV